MFLDFWNSDKCIFLSNGFIHIILSSYSKSFIECSQLVVLWLNEVQLDHCFMYLIFGKSMYI